MQETDSIDEWYRNAQGALEADPGPESWDRLQDSLDVSDVWNRLEVSLDRSKRRAAVIRFYSLIAATVIVSLGLVALLLPSHEAVIGQHKNSGGNLFDRTAAPASEKANRKKENSSSAQQPANSNTASAPVMNEPQPATPQHKQQRSTSDPRTVADQGTKGKTGAHGNDPIVATTSDDSTSISVRLLASNHELLRFMPAKLPFELRNNDSTTLVFLPDTTPQKEKNPGFYFYAFGGARASWLLNKATYKALRPNTDDHLLPLLSPVAGVGLGKQLYKNVALQTSLYLLSSGGQHYIGYNDSTSYDQQLRFQYAGISCSAVFASPRPLLKTSPYNRLEWTTGIYFGLLHSSEVTTTPEPANTRYIKGDNFRNFDGGITGGVRCSFRTKNGLVFSPGLQLNQGVVNIFKGSGDVTPSMNRMFNTQVEASIQLRFRSRR